MSDDPMAWVRVTDKDTGHKRTVRRQELAHGNYTELKGDAVDPVTGDLVPDELADPTPTGQQATSKKEG